LTALVARASHADPPEQAASPEELIMRTSRLALGAAFALLLGISASCDNATTGNADFNGGTRLVLQPGLNISAVPDTIILNPNDSTAPRDSVTHMLIGTSKISALVLDTALAPVDSVPVTFTTTAGTLASGGAPVTNDSTGLAQDQLTVSEAGPTQITVTAASANGTKSVDVFVDIAPVANAGPDQTVECPGPVMLNGSASTDANSTPGTNDDIASYQWFLGDSVIATGEVVGCTLPVGTHVVTLKVTDKMGATDSDTVTVTVVDTTPPVVTLRMSPDRLWPPNHKMKTVHAILDIRDCDPAPKVELVSVTSNEPDNGLGDGDTSNDISGATLGTDDRYVQVRAERAGGGSGRVYTFTYRVTDASGNSTEASATVTVPHDQGH
jgi:hypothetical protein